MTDEQQLELPHEDGGVDECQAGGHDEGHMVDGEEDHPIARGVGQILFVAVGVALSVTAISTTLTLKQAVVAPNQPWAPPSAYTPLAVVMHVAVVALSTWTIAEIVRHRWVTPIVVGMAMIPVVITLWIAAALNYLGWGIIQSGPIGQNADLAAQFYARGGPPVTLIFLSAFGSFVVLLVLHVHLLFVGRQTSTGRLTRFTVCCLSVLAALGLIFPIAYGLMAKDSARDHAIFQDMIRYAASVPDGVVPEPGIGKTSGVNLNALEWIDESALTFSSSLVVCTSEPLSLPATYSPWTRDGDLEGGIVGGLVPGRGEKCFFVRAN